MKRRLMLLMLACMLIFSGIYVSREFNRMARRTKVLIAGYMGRSFGKDISIGSVRIGLFNRIMLKNVSLSEKGKPAGEEFLTCNTVVISYNPFRYLLKRTRLEETIGNIILYSPRLLLSAGEGKPLAMPSIPVKQGIYVRNGEMEIRGLRRLLVLGNMNGVLRHSSQGAGTEFSFSARTNQGNNDRVKLEGSMEENRLKLALNINNAELKNYCAFLPDDGGVRISKGFGDITLAVNGQFPLSPEPLIRLVDNFSYAGNLRVNGVCVEASSLPLPILNLNGNIYFDNHMVSSSDILCRYSDATARISGTLSNYLSSPEIVMSAESDMDLAVIADLVRAKWAEKIKPVSGSAKITVNVSGKVASPVCSGTASLVRASFAGTDVDSLYGKFDYKDKEFRIQNLQVKLSGGNFTGRGSMDFSDIEHPGMDFTFDLKGMNLSLLPFSKKIYNGDLGVEGKISGTLDSVQYEGNMSIEGFSIGEYALGSVSGPFRYTNRRFHFEAAEENRMYRFSADLMYLPEKDKISISSARILIREGGKIELEGDVYVKNSDRVDLKLTSDDVNVKHMPFLLHYYPEMEGMVAFNGEIKGAVRSPLVTGTVQTRGLKVHGTDVALKTAFSYGNRTLSVQSLSVNDAYSGSLSFDFSRKEMPVSGRIVCSNGRLKVLLSLLPGMFVKGVDGNVRGEVDFSDARVEGGIQSSGRFSITDIDVGGNPFAEELTADFRIRDQKLLVENLYCSSGGGAIRACAEVGLKKDIMNNVNISAACENYVLCLADYAMKLKGDAACRGKLYLGKKGMIFANADVYSKNMVSNGKPFGEAGVRVSYKDGFLYLSSLHVGQELCGDFKFDLNGNPSVSGKLQVNMTDLPHFLDLVGSSGPALARKIAGTLTGGLTFAGLVKAPVIQGFLNIDGGRIMNPGLPFSWKSRFTYDNKVINLSSAKLQLVGPGQVIALTGRIDLSSKYPLQIDGFLENVRTDVLEEILHAKAGISGKFNGSISLKGSMENPEVKLNIASNDSVVAGCRMEKIETRICFQKPALNIESFLARFGENVIRMGAGSNIIFMGDRGITFYLPLELRNIGVRGFSVFGGLELSGKEDFSEGKKQISGTVIGRNLWINQYNMDRIKLRFTYKDNIFSCVHADKNTQFTAKVNMVKNGLVKIEDVNLFEAQKRVLNVCGEIDLEKGLTALDVRTENQGLATPVLSKLFNMKEKMQGQTKFNLQIRAPFKELLSGPMEALKAKPYISGNVEIKGGNIHFLTFDRMSSRFKIDDYGIDLTELTVTKNRKYTINASGKLPYTLNQPRREQNEGISVTISGDNSMDIITYISPVFGEGLGQMDSDVSITGSLEFPVVNGYMKVTKGTLIGKKPKPVFDEVNNLSLDVSIQDNRVRIKDIRGMVKKGTVDITGELSFTKGKPFDMDFVMKTMTDSGVLIKFPFLVIPTSLLGDVGPEIPSSGEVKGEMHIYGNSVQYRIDGEVVVENTRFSYPVLPKYKDEDLGIDFLMPAVWSLRLNGGNNVKYTKEYVSARIKGYTVFTGPTPEMKVNGAIEAIDGDVYYLKANYKIREARMDIIDSVVYIESRSETQVGDDTITMVIERSSLDDVKIKFVSLNDPELSSQDAGLKASGMYYKDVPENRREALLKKELYRLIDATLTSPFISALLRGMNLPIDTVKVDVPIFREYGDSTGARFSFGKYLDKNMYLGYDLSTGLELRHELEISAQVDFISRLFNLPEGGEFLKVRRRIMGGNETFYSLEKQIRFQ